VSRPDRKIRSTRVLGALFVVAGFAAIGTGWYGMVREDQSVDRQFPYLISGGAAGIALLLFGVALLVIAQVRMERRHLSGVVEGLPPSGRAARGQPRPEPEASAFPGRYLKVFGLAVCAAGFASIAIGWNGAARLTVVDQQFPFLLSGGVLGIALVLFGVGTLMLAQIKTERQKLARILQSVGAGGPARVAAGLGMAGRDGLADGMVLAGPSTYHRPDCPLIKGRPGLDPITLEEARSEGLAECRVCRPARRDEAARGRMAGEVAAAGRATGGEGVDDANGAGIAERDDGQSERAEGPRRRGGPNSERVSSRGRGVA